MNRTQKLNRQKRLRLMSEKHGSSIQTSEHDPIIDKQAADKRPSTKRIGDYYVKVKQGSRKQYLNIVSKHKLIRKPLNPNVFANIWESIKTKFNLFK